MSAEGKPTSRHQWSLQWMFLTVAWCAAWFALIRWGGPLYYFLSGMAFIWSSLFACCLYRGYWNAVGMMALVAAPLLAFQPLVADGPSPQVQRSGWEVVGAAAFFCSIIPALFCAIVDMKLQKTQETSGIVAEPPGDAE